MATRFDRSEWRFIDPGHMRACENMAWDAALVEEMTECGQMPLFRFEQFRPHCILVGFHQSVEQEVNLEYCERNGIEISRRITGGGAIYEDETQVGWEFVARKDDPVLPKSKSELFELMGLALAKGLTYLGLEAKFRPKNDIEVNGRKISGTGGTEYGNAIFFHGSLLVDWNIEHMVNALNIPIEKFNDKAISDIRQRVTCLAWELGEAPPEDEIKQALIKGFEETLNIHFVPGTFTQSEQKRYERLLPYYESPEWVFHIRRNPVDSALTTVMRKTPGGLVKLTATLDKKGRRIKQAMFTGDYFCTPPRAIIDLENQLKNVSLSSETIIPLLTDFFHSAQIPGVCVEDLWSLFEQLILEL